MIGGLFLRCGRPHAQRSSARSLSASSSRQLPWSLGAAFLLGPFNVLFGIAGVFPAHASVSAERQAVRLVPAAASVSATNHLALSLAERRYLYVFPVLSHADWMLVDSRDDSLPDMSFLRRRSGINVGVSDLYRQPRLMLRKLQLLRQSPEWQLVYERDDIYVFRRTPL